MYCVITQPQGGSYRPHAVRFHSGSLVNVRVKPDDPKLKKKNPKTFLHQSQADLDPTSRFIHPTASVFPPFFIHTQPAVTVIITTSLASSRENRWKELEKTSLINHCFLYLSEPRNPLESSAGSFIMANKLTARHSQPVFEGDPLLRVKQAQPWDPESQNPTQTRRLTGLLRFGALRFYARRLWLRRLFADLNACMTTPLLVS